MIFQISIDLNIPNKKVHAVVDFDTGLIGFTDVTHEPSTEYVFIGAPIEYKMALLTELKTLCAEERQLNSLVSGKSEAARLLRENFGN